MSSTTWAAPPTRWQRAWPYVRRVATYAFFALVASLVYTQARLIDWGDVAEALRAYPATTLLAAAALAALSHAIYSTFDLIGRRWTRHTLPVRQVMPLTAICYAFNLNLGSLVGGFALRYRLYSRLGLATDTITRVLGLSLVTNWLGYFVLGGSLFALEVITPPAGWKIGAAALQVVGAGLLSLAAGYLAMCAFSPRRSWSVRSHTFTLPDGRMALTQLALSTTNWAVMGCVLYVLFAGQVAYPMVLGTLLVAAVAGVLTHIPAGLGVLEAVFVALLGDVLPPGQLLGGLLAYRALYYVAPLVLATIGYFLLEARGERKAS